MKRAAAAALGLALLSVSTAMAEAPFEKDRAVWNKPADPFPIIANIYYVGTAELSVYLIATPKGLILIDGGLPESVPLIEKNIAALGFKLKDVKLILSGHAHFDHVGGFAKLKKDTGAHVVAMAADKAILETGRIAFGPSKDIAMDPVKVDRAVVDGEKVDLGGTSLTPHLTPGHTPGCTTWTMPVVVGGKAYEVMFAGSISVGGNPLAGNSAYPTIVADYRKTFAKLKLMKADVLLTEHQKLADEIGKAARAKPGTPNPFIDPGELKRYVEAAEHDFNDQLAKDEAATTAK